MKYIFSALGYFFIYSASAQLPVALHDEFNDNSYEWWIGESENYSMKMGNGKYVITTRMNNVGSYSTVRPPFDQSKDFSVEATFIQKSGSTNNGFGLLWGDDGKGQHCAFIISSDGNFKIKNAEGKENLNRWISCNLNPMGSENVLKVEAIKSKWYYYINGEEIANTDPFPMYGPNMGVVNYTDMVLEVDRFTFRQDMGINLPADLTFGVVKENLGPLVNSVYDELGPRISADGRTLMFGVKNSPENLGGITDGEDVWLTTSEDGNVWTKRVNMGSTVNDTDANNLAAVSSDNNTLLFCKSDGFITKSRTQSGWSQPKYINLNFINEAGNMEGNLSADGKAILFTARFRQNLHYKIQGNEKDIYVILQKKEGVWSEPINLGEHINTADDEISPFLAADGRTLYFGSNGRPGYGSYDIYMTKRLGNDWTNWTEPVNLGPEINSPGFDAYFTLSASADYAYQVSNKNSFGKSDLVRLRLPDAIKPRPVVLFRGRTLDANTKGPIAASLSFADIDNHQRLGTSISDPKTGFFRLILENGKYGIHAIAKDYLSIDEIVELEKITQYAEIEKDLFLVPIREDETIELSHVFFQQGKAILKTESFPELDRLVEIMQLSPAMKIELSGHTDNQGSKEVLMKLSEHRVQEVKKYMVKQGIRKDRIAGKGYGPNRPIVANDTNENRERNRRVEFKILRK